MLNTCLFIGKEREWDRGRERKGEEQGEKEKERETGRRRGRGKDRGITGGKERRTGGGGEGERVTEGERLSQEFTPHSQVPALHTGRTHSPAISVRQVLGAAWILEGTSIGSIEGGYIYGFIQ